ncbi:UNVERIFIED_ORG: ABC-type amino acid transport substrate-binding protein [Pantoea brenneri]|nr:ABC-type amino acid transport substrate-binding protein [Pantoea brenneri]
MNKTSRLIALLILAASSHALAEDTSVSYNGQRVSLEANKAPINTVKNPEAIAQLPAGHHFVVPGSFTVAVAALNSPPLTVFSDDNKTLLGSEVDIARLVADSLGLKLNVVPASWERLAAGCGLGQV